MKKYFLTGAALLWATSAFAQSSNFYVNATNGYVGLGTTNPVNALDITTSSGIHIGSGVPGSTSMALYNNAGALTWNGAVLGTGSSISGTTNYIPVFTASNVLGNSRIYQSGSNIGIGTTTPGALLDLGNTGTTLGALRLEGNTSGYVQLQPATTAGSWTMTLPSSAGTNGYVLQTNGAGVTSWVAQSGGGGSITGSGTTNYIPVFTGSSALGNSVMYQHSGNIGIGTTTPSDLVNIYTTSDGNPIHIIGDGVSATAVSVEIDSYASLPLVGGGILGQYSRGSAASPSAVQNGDRLTYVTGAGYNGSTFQHVAEVGEFVDAGTISSTSLPTYIAFYTTSNGSVTRVERARINSSGYLGVGTTSPSYLLHVGASSASGIVAELQNSSGACTHNPGASAEVVSCSSDAKYKSDIQDTGDTLGWLDSLRIRDFTWTATGERKTGVIAQEVQEKHPEMVHRNAQEMYSVDEPNPWKLVKTIQELHEMVQRLEDENKSLVQSTDAQTKAIEDLRQDLDSYKKSHP